MTRFIGARRSFFRSNAVVGLPTTPGGLNTVTGQQAYISPGTYSWLVPAGVYTVSVVCVGSGGQARSTRYGGGGGGLGWKNNIYVTPGQSYTVFIDTGIGSTYYNTDRVASSYFFSPTTVQGTGGLAGTGGSYVGDGGGAGGNGGAGSGGYAGAGGAGGYTGNGGNGGNGAPNTTDDTAGFSGSGGGAGGGSGGRGSGWAGGGGGGVGILGQGTSGAGGANTAASLSTNGNPGAGGSGGTGGSAASSGAYGGSSSAGYITAAGAVRIIWAVDGVIRSFPSTNTTDM